MKALILSGGHGTRLRPLTYSQQKQLIPVANKPVLFYAIEDVIEAGIHDIGIIVGPNKDQVIEAVKSVDWDADIEFIYQGEPLGLAHAIKVARDYLGDDDFVMYLGDNILREGI
ncbi:MAG: NTP transferase domain-containing protein, partial [Caldisericia bacterium]|nr:NTP transferase domain-containing protein [Caldisericia bacterium]